MSSSLTKDPKLIAEKENLDLILPEVNELFLDIDNLQDLEVYGRGMQCLLDNQFVISEDKQTRSKGGNKHIYLSTPNRLTELERVALQACLGSDRTREILSFLQLWQRQIRPATVFFEVKSK